MSIANIKTLLPFGAKIFVRRHNLLRDAHSEARGKLCASRNSSSSRTNLEYCVYYPSNRFAMRENYIQKKLIVCCVGCLLFSAFCGMTYQQTNKHVPSSVTTTSCSFILNPISNERFYRSRCKV